MLATVQTGYIVGAYCRDTQREDVRRGTVYISLTNPPFRGALYPERKTTYGASTLMECLWTALTSEYR